MLEATTIRTLGQARGTRFLYGEAARRYRGLVDEFRDVVSGKGFVEIILPSIELVSMYTDKLGAEVVGQMYAFKDKKGRDLCLRPEGTATCQQLASGVFKNEKDVRIFYETRCWRYEKPQAGRYREFGQFGVEILNPTKDYSEELLSLGEDLVKRYVKKYEIDTSAKRGLAYYLEGGFEITVPKLGTQKQVLGGGAYKEGIGFAIGIDRLLLAENVEVNT